MSEAPQRTVARTQKARWPGWIWAVPLAAVAIVLWLVLRELSAGGVSVRIQFEDAAGMKAGSTRVTYRGLVIGKVSELALADDGRHVDATVRIHDEEAAYLRAGTRFYLAGSTVSLSDPASLKAILGGPTIEMVPGPGAPSRSFIGITGAAPPRLSVAIPFRVRFTGAGGDLKAGAPVTLSGFDVGEVSSVELTVDPDDGSMHTAVQLALDPTRFHFTGAGTKPADWRSLMNAAMTSLVDHHLRARLSQSPPLIGARQIELAQIPDAAPARLGMSDGIAEIPTVESSGIDHLVAAAGQFPLREIGDNLRTTTENVRALSSAPQLHESIVHLDHALDQVDRTLRIAGPKVAPTLQSVQDTVERLKATAGEIDKTVSAARTILGDNPAAPDGSIEPTLLHISEAARSIRTLADYLDAHPESLIKGRSK
jgi:paraquat-inducible protein B